MLLAWSPKSKVVSSLPLFHRATTLVASSLVLIVNTPHITGVPQPAAILPSLYTSLSKLTSGFLVIKPNGVIVLSRSTRSFALFRKRLSTWPPGHHIFLAVSPSFFALNLFHGFLLSTHYLNLGPTLFPKQSPCPSAIITVNTRNPWHLCSRPNCTHRIMPCTLNCQGNTP